MHRCTRLTALLGIILLAASEAETINSYREEFDDTTFRDPINTTASWDTTVGRLQLPAYSPSVAGSLLAVADARQIAVDGDYAFVAAEGAGLKIVDISDPAAMTVVGTFPTTGSSWGIDVDGDYAYLADGGAGLVIVDVSNPASPTQVGAVNPPGGGFSRGVEVQGDYAYLCEGTGGFTVIDVSDPSAPVFADTISTAAGTRRVFVSGNHAYVATASAGLQVVDVTDPTNISIVGSLPTTSQTNGVWVDGDVAFLADGANGLQAVDIVDPANPMTLGTADTPVWATDVYVELDRAYIADGNGGMSTIDVSDPANPVLVSSAAVFGTAHALAVDGDHAYVAADSGGVSALCIGETVDQSSFSAWSLSFTTHITSQGNFLLVAAGTFGFRGLDLTNPENLGFGIDRNTPGSVAQIEQAGDVLYVADGSGGIRMYDFSDTGILLPQIGTHAVSSSADCFAIDGDYLYFTNANVDFQVLDISDPSSPSLVGSYATGFTARRMALAGDFVFMAAGTGGLQVADVSDPAAPVSVGSAVTPDARDVHVAGNYAFVADNDSGLVVIDITTPTLAVFTGSVLPPSAQIRGLDIRGNHVWAVDANTSLYRIDVTDPTSPALEFTTMGSGFGTTGHDVHVTGDYAFVATQSGFDMYIVSQGVYNLAANQGQSLPIDGANDPILHARLTSANNQTIDWEFSVDGTNFETIIRNGGWTAPSFAGTDLIWRSTHTLTSKLSNPRVNWVTLEWLTDHAPIASVADVPGDQGFAVELTVCRSGYDFSTAADPATHYLVYQRTAPVPVSGASQLAGEKSSCTLPPGTWAVVDSVGATESDTYATTLATSADSSGSGTNWVVYLTTTHTMGGNCYVSPPDSGYSIDNIVPTMPTGLVFTNFDQMDWDDSPAPDFSHYAVYGSPSPLFDPAAVLIGSPTVSMFDVTGNLYTFYHVSTWDDGGNQSPTAVVPYPTTSSRGEDTLPTRFAMGKITPTPLRTSSIISFALPREADVRLTIYAASGRRVKQIESRTRPAGRYRVTWDGTDDAGRAVGAGVYFARFDTGSYRETRRIVVVR